MCQSVSGSLWGRDDTWQISESTSSLGTSCFQVVSSAIQFQCVVVFSRCTGSPSSKYVVYATACVYRELYGKITDRKKNCVNNYLLWNKVFLPQMCGELVSCAEFRAILAPFSEVIRKPLLLLLKEWKGRPLHNVRRRSNGFRITSLNGARMALNSAQETSSPHIWGRKTLFQRR